MDDSERDMEEGERERAHKAFRRAVAISGSQVKFAGIVGTSQQNISKLLKNRRLLPPSFVPSAVQATGLSRHELRPDIYPIEELPMPGATPGSTPAEHTQRSAGVPESLKGLQS